ncbi:DUF262 domain-containing protein [Azospirillum cavernae]|uniref:DUF262 domain-containing protein n=1 Tax=Azospirillum cavernae TaxID=2320860 RepID=A0A418W1A7_9PROT|nr:DUF262 domain-containing protein [Azospirillum cavernae]RJF83823.1 DUF262 domain-containing protein [Azospirillum cavernae]
MFKVRPFETKTLSWWHSQQDDIALSPVYQRKGGIWTAQDKSFLIDSIINGYDIPKIYIADFTYVNTSLNENKKAYAVIDGRQRLEAIFDFFNNKITLRDDFVFFDEPSLPLKGLSYRDIKLNYPKIASIYENFNLSVMSVITDEEGKINDLFVRLNKNKPLTGAEIRNAMSGRHPIVIREISRHNFFKKCVRFTTKRGQDLNTAAKILLIEFSGKLVDTKKTHLDRFVEEGEKSQSSDIDRVANRTSSILDAMSEIFSNNDSLLSSQGPIALYYWFVRSIEPSSRRYAREFLNDFELKRKSNRNVAKKNADQADSLLLQYDVLNNSANDAGSLMMRFQILSSLFRDFISKREFHEASVE